MKIFKSAREFPVSPEILFNAFSNPEKLAKWWGPAGFTNSFNVFQFKEGGTWSFIMHGPDGTNYPNESEFYEIKPNSKLVIRHNCPPYFTLTITISAIPNGSLVFWEQDFDSEEIAKNVAHIVAPANEQNLDRLMVVATGK